MYYIKIQPSFSSQWVIDIKRDMHYQILYE